jgi:hypothetical protein
MRVVGWVHCRVSGRRVPAVRTPEDPILLTRFRNKDTGELVNWDPRLLPEALEARSVKPRKFELI